MAALLISGMSGPTQAQKKFVFGYVVKTMINDPFQVTMAESAKRTGQKLGVEVLTFGASGHGAAEEQIRIVENLIARKVDGIVLNPVDSAALVPAAKKIQAAGIPLVMADDVVTSKDYITFIGTDNVRAAETAGEFVIKLLGGKGKVAQIEGEPGAGNAIKRRDGFHRALKKASGIQLVTSITGHWSTPGAVAAAENILQAYPDVNVIFTSSDEMGVGTAQVLERKGLTGKVKLLTFDGIPDGLRLIAQGRSVGDVAQFPSKMGAIPVQILYDIVTKKKKAGDYPKYIDSGAEVVTPETLDAFLKNVWNMTREQLMKGTK